MRTHLFGTAIWLVALSLAPQITRAQSIYLGFRVDLVVYGLSEPTAMAFAPDGRIFVCEKGGKLRVFDQGVLYDFVTLDVDSYFERGLLGIALDPQFATNGYVYLYYTTGAGSLNAPPTPKNRVSRFKAAGNAAVEDSETILLDNIPSDGGNHNAGCLRFGLDGKLYIATGDAGTNPMNSQDLGSLAGKILRINKDGSVPDDNPFFGQAGKRGEIYCYGLRNPFRFCFRPGTNTLFIGDVGESTWEEIDVGQPGGNYGWPYSEGPDNVAGYIAPLYYYRNNDPSAIIGGVFVSGKNYPAAYRNSYFFGDYDGGAFSGFIHRMVVSADNTSAQVFDNLSFGVNPVDFAEGPEGDLYYVSLAGFISRLHYVGNMIKGSRRPGKGIPTPRPHSRN